MFKQLAACAAVFGLAAPLALAQSCDVVFDLNSINSVSTNPTGDFSTEVHPGGPSFPELGGHFYFAGYTKLTGRELFRTDGVSGTAELVFDATPGNPNSTIELIKVVGNQVWFFVESDYENSGLCVTDGTPGGTVRLKTEFDTIRELEALNGKVYFTRDTSTTGALLWETDGTKAGTKLVTSADGTPMPDHVQQILFDATGTKFLLRGSLPGVGGELWSFDGTNATLIELNPGSAGSNPSSFRNFAGKSLFVADDGVVGRELWSTDGTLAGTQLVKDLDGLPTGSVADPGEGDVLGGELYFPVLGAGVEFELWKTDGTAAGTVPVANIDTAGQAEPNSFMTVGGQLFFSANVDSIWGRELWVTDGTAAGTRIVIDIQAGTADGVESSGLGMHALNGELLFVPKHAVAGAELWKTDGMAATLVKDIYPGLESGGPSWMTDLPTGEVLMSARDAQQGRNFWVTDGTPAGTRFAFKTDTSSTDSSLPEDFFSVNGRFFLFTADDGFIGRELYRWDRQNGVQLLMDFNPGEDSSNCYDFTNVTLDGQLVTLFGVNTPELGGELWRTDGTPAGTQLVHDINPTPTIGGFLGHLVYHPAHDRIYFTGDDGLNGAELWTTDGTSAGTMMLVDIEPAVDGSGKPYSGNPREMTPIGDLFVFSAWKIGLQRELWVSDGTPAGTQLLFQFNPDYEGSDPEEFVAFNGLVGFYAFHPGFGRELFVTDGTFDGTTLVRNVGLGTVGSGPWDADQIVAFEGYLYYSTEFGSFGKELWRTDFTWAGTTLVKDLVPGLPSGSPSGFTVGGDGKLYFQVETPNMYDIWTSDGTEAGTVPLPEPMYSGYGVGASFQAVSDGVVFLSTDASGTSVFYGNTSGVSQVCHLSGKYSAGESILCDGDLFLVADHDNLGREIYQLPLPGAYVEEREGASSDVRLTATVPRLGSTVTIEGVNQPQPGLGLLYYSAYTGNAFPYPTDPEGPVWLNPLGLTLVSVVSGPTWTRSFPVPNNPSLIGKQLALQTLYFPNFNFPMTVSNGLQVVVGN